jgi:2,3-bisphosphoglycerate-independent phosphoglycerate mutase
VVDSTAGRLGDAEAEVLLAALQQELASDGVRFLPGEGWRALAIVGGGQAEEIETVSPASFMGEPVASHQPRGAGAEFLTGLMGKAAGLLEGHEINAVRLDLGENPANGIWIWGGGRATPLSTPIRGGGVAVGRHPSFIGLARLGGLTATRPEAKGDPADDLDSLAESAIEATSRADFTVVHAEGALDFSRLGEAEGKVAWLEEADRRLIGPLADALVATGEGRLLIAAGHIASTELRRDLPGIVPFVVTGPGTPRYGEARFTESGAADSDLVVENGHELLEFASRA